MIVLTPLKNAHSMAAAGDENHLTTLCGDENHLTTLCGDEKKKKGFVYRHSSGKSARKALSASSSHMSISDITYS